MYKTIKEGNPDKMEDVKIRKNDIVQYKISDLKNETDVVRKSNELIDGLEQRGIKAQMIGAWSENQGVWTIQLKIKGKSEQSIQTTAIGSSYLIALGFLTAIVSSSFD